MSSFRVLTRNFVPWLSSRTDGYKNSTEVVQLPCSSSKCSGLGEAFWIDLPWVWRLLCTPSPQVVATLQESGSYKKEVDRVFSRICSDSTMENGLDLI